MCGVFFFCGSISEEKWCVLGVFFLDVFDFCGRMRIFCVFFDYFVDDGVWCVGCLYLGAG